MKRRLLTVLLAMAAGPVAAFDGESYFKDSWYGRPPLFSVVVPFGGIRWDYLYGFGANNIPYPTGGVEWYLLRDNPARDDHAFIKLRLAWAGGYGYGTFDGGWREYFFGWPGVDLYAGYAWTWRSAALLFVERVQPFVALGGGSHHPILFSTVDFPSVVVFSEADFPHVGLQAGTDLVAVKHLMGLRLVWTVLFGRFVQRDVTTGGPGPLDGRFHSSMDLCLGFVMYLR